MPKTLRRSLVVLCSAGLVAYLRLRGESDRVVAASGGWRELAGPDLR